MKQKLLNSLRLRLCLLVAALLCVGGKAWGEETVFYTLDGTTTGGSSGYDDAGEIVQNGITWKVMGNTTMNPWRIGGKSLNGVDRPVYSTTAMPSAINKVDLTVGTASSITVNSLKLIVASDADFNNKLDEVTATFSASSTITFQPTTGTEWATGSYYKFIFNVTVSGSSNKFVQFTKAEFYSLGVDNRTPVNITDFTASSTTLIKGATATTTVTNDQSGWTAAYTYSSNNTSVATVDADGVITAVGKGTATITATLNIAADNENYKVGETPSKTVDITVNNPTHTATFSINGTTSTANFEEDAAISFPTNIEDINGKTFVGWVTEAIDGVTDTEPTMMTSATMGENDVTYYAVFATMTEGNYTEVTDNLNRSATGKTGTAYEAWSNVQLESDAIYAGTCAGGKDIIQLNSGSPRGIISSTSGGTVKKVIVTWGGDNTANRALTVYGSNTTYSSSADLSSSSTRGTNLGSITFQTGNTTGELTINGNYSYVGFYSSSAIYISNIAITWTSGVPDTYSAYCTTIVADTRQEAGISFAVSAYTAELMGEFTSPVLTNPNNLTVVWSSSDEEVATVNNGVVTILAEGETVINAAFEGNDDYKPANANYALTVQDSRAESNPTFATENVTVEIGATVAAPTLTKAGDGAVTYSTSNAAIATVDATTGVVTGVALGTATITATVAETSSHKAGSATFTITVFDPNAVMFDFDNDYATLFPNLDGVSSGSGSSYVSDGDFWEAQTATVNGVSLTVSEAEDGNQNNNRIWASSPRLRMYSGTLTITAPEGYVIKNLAFNQSKWNNGNTADSGTLTSDGWNGEANTVVISIAGNTQFKSINVSLAQVQTVSVSTAGFATFCSDKALDFTNTQIKAFIGTRNGTSLVFNQINKVPANTGVLLYKVDGATENVPVVAAGDDATGNCLVGVTAQTTISEDDYILSRSTDGVGFYKAGSHTTLAANRAYIPAAAAAGIKSFAINFGDADAIMMLNDQTSTLNGETYNIAGQRVSKLNKGLYIVSGKKVLVK
ncbi:MAG: Ig-like domain-containing protein [Bacteroidaceae bacterium]|nr:Ig-like domain-containing protein [Bacteroidaceae bacterium]